MFYLLFNRRLTQTTADFIVSSLVFIFDRYTYWKMLKEIGWQFDIGDFGVSQASRRIAMKISQDNNPGKRNRKIENKLKMSRMKT